MELLESIEKEASKTWKYFVEFLEANYTGSTDIEVFVKLPFEMQLGVYIAFFNSVSTDVELYSTEMDALKDAVLESFKQYEEYLFLDS